MLINFFIFLIKYSAFFFCVFFVYGQISALKLNKYVFIDIVASVPISAILYFATLYLRIAIPLFLFIFSAAYLWARYRHPFFNTVSKAIASCGITSFIFILAHIILIPVYLLLFNFIQAENIRDILAQVLYSVLHICGVAMLFRIKRFKSGISPDKSDSYFELLLLCSGICLIIMTLFYGKNVENIILVIALISIIFCGLLLIFWWRKHISDNYKNRIFARNTKLLENQINSYVQKNCELITQNDELAKIIHRDNKLIPAMLVAVEKISTKYAQDEDLQDFLCQLDALSQERKKIIESYQSEYEQVPKSGILSLDAVLYYIFSTAKKYNVDCSFTINDEAVKAVAEAIKKPIDLNTLLCDLGENAVISAKSRSAGRINLTFEFEKTKIPYIAVYDNGPAFEEKVIAVMGKKMTTTHKNDGGNGIGLMTIFDILRKYDASFYLNEITEKAGFTKEIKICFDGKKTLNIYTESENIKKAFKKRTDII